MKHKYGRFSRISSKSKNDKPLSSSKINAWQLLCVMFATVFIPWGIYVVLHPSVTGGKYLLNFTSSSSSSSSNGNGNFFNGNNVTSLLLGDIQDSLNKIKVKSNSLYRTLHDTDLNGNSQIDASNRKSKDVIGSNIYGDKIVRVPVLGSVANNGAKPLYGEHHSNSDAIFALACNYKLRFYQRFVGTLRLTGFDGDIVLAVSPPEKMASGVGSYLKEQNVTAYGFEVDCQGKDNCRLKDDFLGYPDPRPHRTFANIRYALYEYWLNYYNNPASYFLILDFRDTFFQMNPFASFGPIATRPSKGKYELHVFAENYKVKNIGKCVYNSLWVGRCFGKDALKELKQEAVLCSGSTLGSYEGIDHYIATMLRSMDTVQCWKKGIESDQGYQNYLYYNGKFTSPLGHGNATFNHQGHGIVNTIGALNGRRVPKELKGPLDTHWKIRDNEGYILNYDGTRSAVVHQWDRWYSEVVQFLDKKLLGFGKVRGKPGKPKSKPRPQAMKSE